MPETATLFSAGSYTSATLFPMPNNISMAAPASRKVTLEAGVGNAGVGWLIVQPQYAGFSNANNLFVTDGSAYLGNSFPTSGTAGLTNYAVDTTTGYTCDGLTYAWTAYARLTLKANSAALTNKSGRLIMGLNWNELASSMTPSQLAVLRTTTTFALDQVTESAMPTILNVPMLHNSCPTAPPTSTTTFPCMFVCIDGAPANTTFEFEFEYVAIMAGAARPWKMPVEFDTDIIAPAICGLQATSDKGFTHAVAKEQKKAKQHVDHVTNTEVKKQPLLSRIVDFGKDILAKTPIGGILRRAVGFASKLF